MRDPPIPPAKFIHSDLLKILAGPNLKQFSIHSGLLAELSEEMRPLVYKDMGEGVKAECVDALEMKGVSEETMAHFLEFCYTGGYNVHYEMTQMRDTTGHVAGDVEDREKALAHARLYVFAKRYSIEAVQELSVGNLGKFVGYPSIVKTSVIPCLVEYALENIPEEPITDRLVVLLARGTALMIGFNTKRELVHPLLASISRKDFFATFCETVTYNAGAALPKPSGAIGQEPQIPCTGAFRWIARKGGGVNRKIVA